MPRSGSIVLFLLVSLLIGVIPVLAADPAPEIPITIEKNRFQPDEIKVKAGVPFVLVVTNKDATAEEFESKDLRIEKVIAAGKTLKIRIRALKPGVYPFVGDYHQSTAKGRIVAE
jgi:plastocyanin